LTGSSLACARSWIRHAFRLHRDRRHGRHHRIDTTVIERVDPDLTLQGCA
jgi:hypothetical protein